MRSEHFKRTEVNCSGFSAAAAAAGVADAAGASAAMLASRVGCRLRRALAPATALPPCYAIPNQRAWSPRKSPAELYIVV